MLVWFGVRLPAGSHKLEPGLFQEPINKWWVIASNVSPPTFLFAIFVLIIVPSLWCVDWLCTCVFVKLSHTHTHLVPKCETVFLSWQPQPLLYRNKSYVADETESLLAAILSAGLLLGQAGGADNPVITSRVMTERHTAIPHIIITTTQHHKNHWSC